MRVTNSKKIGWFFNRTGELAVDFSIAKAGFVPGEVIPLNCTINNSSKQDMAGVMVEIMQVTAQGDQMSTLPVTSL